MVGYAKGKLFSIISPLTSWREKHCFSNLPSPELLPGPPGRLLRGVGEEDDVAELDSELVQQRWHAVGLLLQPGLSVGGGGGGGAGQEEDSELAPMRDKMPIFKRSNFRPPPHPPKHPARETQFPKQSQRIYTLVVLPTFIFAIQCLCHVKNKDLLQLFPYITYYIPRELGPGA